MIARKKIPKLIGFALAATVILTACTPAATSPAPTFIPAAPTPSPIPIQPTATATNTPMATDTPVASLAATPTPLGKAFPTQSVAQVIPIESSYCRRGPGTGYDPITVLNIGVAYNVVGRNSLNTWWLVQIPGAGTCWMGDPISNQLGPLDQAPIVLVPPALKTPALFVNSYTCDTTHHTLGVSFNWAAVQGVTGYRIYRNGVVLVEVAAGVTAYHDIAPLKIDLVYQLEAFNDLGVANRISTRVPACE
jgi:hypothetical protein